MNELTAFVGAGGEHLGKLSMAKLSGGYEQMPYCRTAPAQRVK